MVKLTTLDWKAITRALKFFGAVYKRTKGSHVIHRKPGIRALVFPKDKDVAISVVKNLIRDLGVTNKEFMEAAVTKKKTAKKKKPKKKGNKSN